MSVDDDIDEKIQEAVEQKVEERLDEERDRIKEEVREELLRKDAETSSREESEKQGYSRRSFLKALGLGAGGLALSSAASADLLSLNTVAGDKTQNLGNILQNSNTASTGIDMNGNPITDSTGGPVDINADRLDGNQASNFATANDLSNHAGVTGAHHTKYTDENAQDAVGTILGSNLNYDDTNNNISLNQGSGSGLDSDQVDGFDIQKNGNDTNGVINFNTNQKTITVDGTLISGSPIPDSEDLSFNYDFSKSTDTSSVPDDAGNKTSLTGGSFTTSTKNGVQVAFFDGSSDQELNGSFGSSVSLPIHMFWVAKSDSTGSYYLWSHDNEGWHVEGSEWSWFDGSTSFTFGSSDTNWHVFDMLIESGSFDFGVDGASTTTLTSSNSSFSELVIGDWVGGNNDWEGGVGLVLAYGENKTAKRSDIANALGSIYGISIN